MLNTNHTKINQYSLALTELTGRQGKDFCNLSDIKFDNLINDLRKEKIYKGLTTFPGNASWDRGYLSPVLKDE